jgi:hypothetical protein
VWVVPRAPRSFIANPLQWSTLCAAALILGALGSTPVALIAYALMIAALMALSKAATDHGVDAAEMATEDPAWRAHTQTLRTLPFSAIEARADWCPRRAVDSTLERQMRVEDEPGRFKRRDL